MERGRGYHKVVFIDRWTGLEQIRLYTYTPTGVWDGHM